MKYMANVCGCEREAPLKEVMNVMIVAAEHTV